MQAAVPNNEPASFVNLNTCDLGASPNLQPKVMKPYRRSPLQEARQNPIRNAYKGKKWKANATL